MTQEDKDNKIITFGCRLNAYESEAIKEALKKTDQKNLLVFNSCAVTAEAERELRAAVRRLVEGAQLIDELDRQKRTPTRNPGAPCRWCPIAATCDVGTAYLNGESDDPDGF